MHKKSVVRSIEILSLISKAKDGLSLNEIVTKTSIPKTTVYEILLMLQATDMIQIIDGRTKLFKIGLKAFVIGNMYLENLDLVKEAKPVVSEVSKRLNMTIFIAELEDTQIIYLYKQEPKDVSIHTANVANREDAYCTSLGKAIIANLPLFEQKPILEKMDFRERTSRTIMDIPSLRKELDITKLRGYSIDDREILDSVLCLGAPIFNNRGKVIAAISTAGLFSETRNIDEEGNILIEAANRISKSLGFFNKGAL